MSDTIFVSAPDESHTNRITYYINGKAVYSENIDINTFNLQHKLNVDLVSDIQNPVESPWLSWLVDGVKEWEGRLHFKKDKDSIVLRKSKFGLLNIGYKVALYSDSFNKRTYYIFQVSDIRHYFNFADAFTDLGNKLVPSADNPQQVQSLYEKFWTRDEITNNATCFKLLYTGCHITIK